MVSRNESEIRVNTTSSFEQSVSSNGGISARVALSCGGCHTWRKKKLSADVLTDRPLWFAVVAEPGADQASLSFEFCAMEHPLPPSSQEGDDADGAGVNEPVNPRHVARSMRGTPSQQSYDRHDNHHLGGDSDGFDSEEFREWMRQRGQRRRPDRRRSDDSDGSRDDREGRSNSGPAPEWDGESCTFQDFAIKARSWLATTRAKPRTRGPLLLQRLSKVPFESMKHLARDSAWMASSTNGEELIRLMDQAEYFGEDRDEDLLSALSKITYHIRREKNEQHRSFFNRWEVSMRKVNEHHVSLPEKYVGFLLINALCLADSDIKAMLNYTRGSISPADIKDWIRKHETKLQAAHVGADAKKSGSGTGVKANLYVSEEASDPEEEEINMMEEALRSLQDRDDGDEHHGDEEIHAIEEHEAAEILSTLIQKKRSFAQTLRAKKTKELGRGYHSGQSGKGSGKSSSFPSTGTGKHPFKTGQFKLTIEELKKVTRCGICKKLGHWHRECPDANKDQHLLETDEATFCGFLIPDADEPNANFVDRGSFPIEEEPKPDAAVGSDDVVSATSPYNDRSRGFEDWEVFLGEKSDNMTVPPPNHHRGSFTSTFDDEACATIDTGCQRMAIGLETLKKMSEHIPDNLQIQLHKQEHRFRSVHGKSSTSHVASIPSCLGHKGSLLRPAVFENEGSRNAPFLISLPFLMFCKATLHLDPDVGLKIHLKKFGFTVPCHLGPTGALRVPLCHFSQLQLNTLEKAQEDLRKTNQEFEVFRTDTEQQQVTGSESQPLKSPATSEVSDQHGAREEAHPSHQPRGSSSGSVESFGGQADVCHSSSQSSSSTSTATAGEGDQLQQARDFNRDADTKIGGNHHEFRDDRDGILQSESYGSNDSQPRSRDGDRASGQDGGTTGPMPAWRDNGPVHMPETRTKLPQAVLEMPTSQGSTVSDLHVVCGTTLHHGSSDHLSTEISNGAQHQEQDGTTRKPDREQLRSSPTPSSKDIEVRHQCIPKTGTLCGLWKGVSGREDQHGTPKDSMPNLPSDRSPSPRLHPEQGGNVQGVLGLEEAKPTGTIIETSSEDAGTKYHSKGLKRLLRQADAALREAELLWNDITTHLSESTQKEDPKCHEHLFLNSVHQRKTGKSISGRELRRYANLLGVTKREAKVHGSWSL